MVQRDTNTAPAEKGIVFFYGEVRQHLVATDIQRTHCYRRRRKSFQYLPVGATLFFLSRETVAHQKRDLGTVQTDTFGATTQRGRDVGQQPGIRIQRQSLAI